MRRMLIVHTSLGPSFNFTLQATVPLQMLHTCATAVPRHYREFIFYCYILVTMVLTLLSVLLFAYFDADRICSTGRLTDNTRTVASGVCDGGGVFDLSRVAGLPGSRMVETHVGGDGDGVAFPPSIVKRQAAGAHTLTSTTKRGHWTPGPEYCHHISSNPVLRLIRCAVPSGSFFLRQVRSIFHSPEWSHQHPRLVATPVGSLSGEFVSHGGVTGTDNLADSDNCPADDTDVEPKPTALVRQHMMKPSKRTKIGRRLSAGLPLGQLDRALPGHSFDLNRVAPPFHSTPQVDPCHLNKADLLTTGVCAAKAVAKLEASGGMSGRWIVTGLYYYTSLLPYTGLYPDTGLYLYTGLYPFAGLYPHTGLSFHWFLSLHQSMPFHWPLSFCWSLSLYFSLSSYSSLSAYWSLYWSFSLWWFLLSFWSISSCCSLSSYSSLSSHWCLSSYWSLSFTGLS